MLRKIIHCDADCFFAALEERDNPRLKNRPLAVGGASASRGVIATCNYAARRFGVRSAMASAQALRLCPDLVIVRHRMDVYRQASSEMHEIFSQYTDEIEPLSLDEAFLDVSESYQCLGSASLMAQEIRWQIRKRVGITVSAGIAVNKFLAKVASDWRKPDGQTVILPRQVSEFVRALPVTKIPGVGHVMNRKMQGLGISTCADLQEYDISTLIEWFGGFGEQLYQLCRGNDDRLVKVARQRKSISIEHTFDFDLPDATTCQQQISMLMPKLLQRLDGLSARGLTVEKALLKMKFADFTSTSVERKGTQPRISTYRTLCEDAFSRGRRPVRLLGIGVKLLDSQSVPDRQMELFKSIS